MEEMLASPAQIADYVRDYFRSKKKTLKSVAAEIGITSPTFIMQLRSSRGLPYDTAKALSELYGFNFLFLKEGKGIPFSSEKSLVERSRDTHELAVDYKSSEPSRYSQRQPILPKENLGEVMHELSLIELLVRELSLKIDRLQRDVDYLKTTPIGD